MNKLFTKVAALTLGVAMAAGVGVALGSAKASEAKAAEETITLDFATAGLTAFASGTVNQGLSYTYVKDSGSSNPVFTKASGEAQYSLKLYNGNYLCIEINDTASYASFKSIQCKVTSKNGSTSGSGTYYKDSLTSTSLYTHTLTSGTFVDGNTVDVDGASKIYIKCSAGQYRIGKFVIVMNKQGDVPSTQYNVTDSVENGSVSPSTVSEGATLTATITPDTGYNVPETVSVTMGGVAATHTYQNGVVTVENVTGDVEITGSCVEIPVTPEPAVIETTLADFIAATDADYTKAYHFSATIKAFKTGDTKDKYGNMTLTDGTTDLTVYGSTADATKLVWNGVSEKYEFTNPQDFMTTELTNNSKVGDTVEVKFIRYLYSSKVQGQGIILSVTPGETPEIPEPEMVTGKKLSDLFADTAGNGKQLYEVTGVVSAWASGKSDATQYGNFYLKESLDSDTEYYIYGATADATKLVWGTASGVYGFSNPKDFLTNEVTKDVVIGSTLTMRLTRCDYGTTLEANGIVVSVVPPAAKDWTDSQKTNFEAALDGFVPPFVKTTADPTINAETGYVEYYGEGDVKDSYVSYFTQNDWHDDLGGYYSKESPNGNGLITGYVGDATATGTFIMFQYNVYVIVTVVEGEDSTEHKIGSGSNFVLPQPTESSIPAGKQFKAWEVDSKEFDPGDILEQVTSAVTVVAVYEDIPAPAPTLESIAVSGEYKTKYAYQEDFDEEGIVVTATYSDQSQQTVDLTDVEFSGYDKSDLGEQTVTVTYQEKTTTFTVTVYYTATYKPGEGTPEDGEYVDYIPNPDDYVLVSFEQTGFVAPTGKQFKEWSQGTTGKSVQVNGNLSFTAVYEDIPAPTDWSDTFKSTFSTRFGSTVYPTFFEEFADDNNIEWHATAAYCTMTASGNLLNKVANAFYADSNWSYLGTSMVYQNEYCFENKDEVNAYAYAYGGNTYIVLCWVTSIKVDASEAKTEYYVGDTLDLTNVYVHYQLADGDWFQGHVIDPKYWTASPTTLDEAGDAITISIDVSGMYQLSYTVKVTPVVMESISISGELSKTEYTEGDAWDATGLVATAHYNNGTEDDITAQVSWTFQPEETVVGTDSVSVVATLGEISSQAANFDVVVNEPAPAYDADAFAKELLEKVAPICANYDGKKNNKTALKGVWTEMALKYETLSEEEKAKVVEAVAKTDGTDLEKAMAFYNYACKKYGLTKFIAGRQVKAIVNEQVSTGNSILPIIVIVAASVTAVTAIGVVIALKRRKNFLTK